jgi:hypothetical protein
LAQSTRDQNGGLCFVPRSTIFMGSSGGLSDLYKLLSIILLYLGAVSLTDERIYGVMVFLRKLSCKLGSVGGPLPP